MKNIDQLKERIQNAVKEVTVEMKAKTLLNVRERLEKSD